ncbi:MAG: MraY family glycosyltransferase [Chloroflexota bacterium]
MNYLLIFGAAFFAVILSVPFGQWLSVRFGILAKPGGRRKHEGLIPKLGGLPLIFGLAVAWGLILWRFPINAIEQKLVTGIMMGTVVIVLGGLLDDRYDLPPLFQTAVHLSATLIAIRFDVFIEVFTTPAFLLPMWETAPFSALVDLQGAQVWMIRPLAIAFTFFWILGMINAVNWLDGLDGLASGVGLIAALVFAWHSYSWQNFSIAAFPLALAAGLLGFLIFNFAPAKVYLGSAGAFLLGYQLATLSIVSPAKIMTALLVLALPILDVAWRIFDRARNGRNLFEGDRGHLHYLLVDNGLPVRPIVIGYYLCTIIFGIVVLWLPTPELKISILIVLGTAVIVILRWLSTRQNQIA